MTDMSSIGWKEGGCFVGEFKRLIKRLGMGRRYVLLLLLRAPFDGARAWMLAALMKSVFRCLEAGDALERYLKSVSRTAIIKNSKNLDC